LEDVIESYGSTIPSYRDLEALLNQLNVLAEVVDQREQVCDKGMRLMAKERKDRMAELEIEEGERREKEGREEVEREREREREREKDRDRERGRKKGDKGEKKKRRDGEGSTVRDRDGRDEKERPVTHGAHGSASFGKLSHFHWFAMRHWVCISLFVWLCTAVARMRCKFKSSEHANLITNPNIVLSFCNYHPPPNKMPSSTTKIMLKNQA
jgi:hypothetical protein